MDKTTMQVLRIRASNYRSLSNVDLGLGPFTVIVGPNGVGKSTLLEVIRLMSCIKQGDSAFRQSFARFGGFSQTVSWRAGSPSIGLGISRNGGGNCPGGFDYDLTLTAEGNAYFVEREKILTNVLGLERQDGRVGYLIRTIDRNDKHDSELPHGPRLAIVESVSEDHRRRFLEPLLSTADTTHLVRVHRFRPDQRVLGSQQLQATVVPSEEGDDLYSALYTMRSERPADFAELMDAMRCAVPDLLEIDFPPASAGHVYLTWKQESYPRKLSAQQLSDGTIRFLWLMTVLYGVPEGGLLLLDEPELSLHPQWIMYLVSLLRKRSFRTTIVVATQSPELLRWLQPEELVVSDADSGGTTFTPATDVPNLKRWVEDFTLSDLWLMGNLGGRS